MVTRAFAAVLMLATTGLCTAEPAQVIAPEEFVSLVENQGLAGRSDKEIRALSVSALWYRDHGINGTWSVEWAKAIDEAWARGLLTDAQIADYLDNAVDVYWAAGTRRDGANYFMAIITQNAWARGDERLPHAVTFRVRSLSLTSDSDGKAVEPFLVRSMHWDELDESLKHVGTSTASFELSNAQATSKATLAWEVVILDANTMRPIGEPWKAERVLDIPDMIASGKPGGTFRDRDDLVPPNDLR